MKNKKLIIFLIVFISVIILLSLLLFILSTIGFSKYNVSKEKETSQSYGGMQFIKEGEYWKFNKNGNNYLIKTDPSILEGIEIPAQLNAEGYYSNPLYFVGELNDGSYAMSNFNKFTSRTQEACLDGDTNGKCNFLPSKKCSDDNIMVFREPQEDEKERVYLDEECIFIIAEKQNQELFLDYILLRILGIH